MHRGGFGFQQQSYGMQQETCFSEVVEETHYSTMNMMKPNPCIDHSTQLFKHQSLLNGLNHNLHGNPQQANGMWPARNKFENGFHGGNLSSGSSNSVAMSSVNSHGGAMNGKNKHFTGMNNSAGFASNGGGTKNGNYNHEYGSFHEAATHHQYNNVPVKTKVEEMRFQQGSGAIMALAIAMKVVTMSSGIQMGAGNLSGNERDMRREIS